MEDNRQVVKFSFFKIDPAWRRLDREQRNQDKREFAAACDDFAVGNFLRTYSLVGTRGDADMLLLNSASQLEEIHEFHVVLSQSGLAKYYSAPYSYLAMTRKSEYSDEERLSVRMGNSKYLFVYPFWKKREWYRLPAEERMKVMKEHINIGQKYPEISINTTYCFGIDDPEFVVSFEGDSPGQFMDLVMELRGSESSIYTLQDTPIFTSIAVSTEKMLNALDGTALLPDAVN